MICVIWQHLSVCHYPVRMSLLNIMRVGNSPVTGALVFSLICARINGWVKNGEADLRRHHAHYDVGAMWPRSRKGRHTVRTFKLVEAGWRTHICVSKLGNHWFRWWLVAHLSSSHYLNQCYPIVNLALSNKLQGYFDKYTTNSVEKLQLKLSPAQWHPFVLASMHWGMYCTWIGMCRVIVRLTCSTIQSISGTDVASEVAFIWQQIT